MEILTKVKFKEAFMGKKLLKICEIIFYLMELMFDQWNKWSQTSFIPSLYLLLRNSLSLLNTIFAFHTQVSTGSIIYRPIIFGDI